MVYIVLHYNVPSITISEAQVSEYSFRPFEIVHPNDSSQHFTLHLSVSDKHVRNLVKQNQTLTSLHKSNLQKAIRLGNVTAALFSFDWLFRYEPVELFRRLPIILIEDSALHAFFPSLVLYGVAYEYIDPIHDDMIYSHTREVILDTLVNKVHQRTLVYSEIIEDLEEDDFFGTHEKTSDPFRLCLLIRYCYGGLAGDLRMIRRFLRAKCLFYTSPNACNMDSSKKDQEESYLLSAVDFHVFPSLLEEIRKELLKHRIIVDCDTIQSAIWNIRSRTNFREDYTPVIPEWWEPIVLPYLSTISKQYWSVYLSMSGKEVKIGKRKPNTVLNYFSQKKK